MKAKAERERLLAARLDLLERQVRLLKKQIQICMRMGELKGELDALTDHFADARARHRREGFHNGDEKREWLLAMMREHPDLSQQDIERTLLPLRTPLPPMNTGREG